MTIEPTPLAGCFLLQPRRIEDVRGSFTKLFHEPTFREHGLCTNFPEEYFSESKAGVLRGLHFQTPPHDHVKLVTCLAGEVLDVLLDLRKGSPTFGKTEVFCLSATNGRMLYIPPGIAHGFFAPVQSLMLYKTSTVHAPANDTGILWSSVHIEWSVHHPILSARDAALPPWSAFDSPFRMESRS